MRSTIFCLGNTSSCFGCDKATKQRRTGIGEPYIGAALVPPEPALRDGPRDPGAEVIATATRSEERRVDPLDVDAAILHRLDAVRDLDQLAGGDALIGPVAAFDTNPSSPMSQAARNRSGSISPCSNSLMKMPSGRRANSRCRLALRIESGRSLRLRELYR